MKNKLFKSDNIISIIALLLSMISIIYSYTKDKKDDNENITINSTYYGYFLNDKIDDKTFEYEYSKVEDLLTEMKYHTVNVYGYLPVNYEIIISNNSKKRVSIVKTDVEEVFEKDIKKIPEQYLGIFLTKIDKANMPIVLDSGESKLYILRINVRLSKRVMDIIKEHLILSKEINIGELKNILYEHDLDIYDNDYIYLDKFNIKGVPMNSNKFPKYLFTIYSSTGKNFKYLIDFKKFERKEF